MIHQELVKQATQGSKEAFSELYQRTKNLTRKTLRKKIYNSTDLEDVFSNVYCTAWRKISCLQPPFCFINWLKKIIFNEVRTYYKAKHYEEIIKEPSYEESFDYLDQKQQSLFSLVSPVDREILEQFYVEGKNTKEIGKKLRKQPSVIRARLCRARNLIRKELV